MADGSKQRDIESEWINRLGIIRERRRGLKEAGGQRFPLFPAALRFRVNVLDDGTSRRLTN